MFTPFGKSAFISIVLSVSKPPNQSCSSDYITVFVVICFFFSVFVLWIYIYFHLNSWRWTLNDFMTLLWIFDSRLTIVKMLHLMPATAWNHWSRSMAIVFVNWILNKSHQKHWTLGVNQNGQTTMHR